MTKDIICCLHSSSTQQGLDFLEIHVYRLSAAKQASISHFELCNGQWNVLTLTQLLTHQDINGICRLVDDGLFQGRDWGYAIIHQRIPLYGGSSRRVSQRARLLI